MRKWKYTAAAVSVALLMQGCATGSLHIIPTYGTYGAKYASAGLKRPYPHQGVDYKAPRGSLVFAAADGVVTTATHLTMPKKGWGRFDPSNTVGIKHSGIAEGFHTLYAHLERVDVNFGDTVRRGQVLGTIGQCGKGPQECSYHLHFEVREGVFTKHNPEHKIAGCLNREGVTPTRERPLVYPLRC